MDFVLIVLAVVIWVALAFWPARVAARKGHSFLGYFVFSLFLWPVALIVAYVVQDRTVVVQDRPAPTPS
jgi:hypothetical protein